MQSDVVFSLVLANSGTTLASSWSVLARFVIDVDRLCDNYWSCILHLVQVYVHIQAQIPGFASLTAATLACNYGFFGSRLSTSQTFDFFKENSALYLELNVIRFWISFVKWSLYKSINNVLFLFEFLMKNHCYDLIKSFSRNLSRLT